MVEPSGGMATTLAESGLSARPIMFVIPGMGGDSTALAALREDWSSSLDCVLLDYPDWPILGRPGFGMGAMLDSMIATLRAYAQARPIVLAGFSLGGFVAWAIALRLAGTATPVAMLFVLDADMATPLPLLSHGSSAARLGRFLRSLGSALRNRNLGPVEKVVGDYIGCRLALATGAIRAAARVRFLPLPSGLRFRIRFSLCSQLQLPLVRTWLVEEDAYSLRLDHTPVVLICAASERGQNDAAATLGWEVRCTDLKVEWVDGDHNSMLCHRGKNSLYAQLIQALTLLQKFGLPTRINERE